MTNTDQRTPTHHCSWGVTRGKMVVSSSAHSVDATSRTGRTMCGVTIPTIVWRWLTTGERPSQPSLGRKWWVNDEQETEEAAPCGRCARLATSARVVPLDVWRDLHAAARA